MRTTQVSIVLFVWQEWDRESWLLRGILGNGRLDAIAYTLEAIFFCIGVSHKDVARLIDVGDLAHRDLQKRNL